jgi:abortive infection bacteriophage resistance protein
MTKIILQSRSYDVAEIYNFGDFVNIFGNMARANQNTFASDYERRQESARNQISRLVENFMADRTSID